MFRFLRQLEIINVDDERKEELSEKINGTAPCSDVEDALVYGVFKFSLHHISSPLVSSAHFRLN